jgi:hypothetical protein
VQYIRHASTEIPHQPESGDRGVLLDDSATAGGGRGRSGRQRERGGAGVRGVVFTGFFAISVYITRLLLRSVEGGGAAGANVSAAALAYVESGDFRWDFRWFRLYNPSSAIAGGGWGRGGAGVSGELLVWWFSLEFPLFSSKKNTFSSQGVSPEGGGGALPGRALQGPPAAHGAVPELRLRPRGPEPLRAGRLVPFTCSLNTSNI